MAFGVYKIENKADSKIYVGSTVLAFDHRWGQHRSQLGRRCHANHYLQEDWDKYGKDCFSFSILEVVKDKSTVLGYEQKWLNEFLGSNKEVYNIRISATAPASGQAWRHRRVLSDEEVTEIKRVRHTEKVSLRGLAERYNVSESAISRICNNKRRIKPRKKKNVEVKKKKGVKPKKTISIRLPDKLHAELKKQAEENYHSINKEVGRLIQLELEKGGNRSLNSGFQKNL